MSIINSVSGVSNCYVFKSRLQEYAQKVGLVTPIYETVKEGPSHEPCFRSTVIVDNVRYDSLPGFFNRKAAEQSAAEVALMEIAKARNSNESIASPVHETGLCKNLLQEYAQKMNYAIPSYVSHKNEKPGNLSEYSCTVDVGGIQYIGAVARTKKEAEIRAARTALLAIHYNSNGNPGAKTSAYPQLTVVPIKKTVTGLDTQEEKPKASKPKKERMVAESDIKTEETPKALKPKKRGFKKKWPKTRCVDNMGNQAEVDSTKQMEVDSIEQVTAYGGYLENSETLGANVEGLGGQLVGSEVGQNVQQMHVTGEKDKSSNGYSASSDINQSEQGISNVEVLSAVEIKDSVTLVAQVNKDSGIEEVAQSGAAEALVVAGEGLHSTNTFEGSHHDEVGRMAAEDGNVQRPDEEVKVSPGVDQEKEILPQ